MKRIQHAFVCGVVLITSAIVLAPKANAVPSNEIISQRCAIAQGYASGELKQNDLRTRVNRLQIYEYIHQRLDILAKRLEYNQQDGAKQFRTALDDYLQKIELFKQRYEEYDAAREVFSGLPDCKENPTEFAKALSDMRQKRATLEKVTASINRFFNQEVTNQLVRMQEDFKTAQKGPL